MLRKSVVILAMLMCSMATQVFALGLGRVTVESALNEPLRVRIEVIQLGETRLDDVTVQMASLDDFQRFNIDRVGFLSNIRFRIESTAQGNFVVLTSNQIVREPYLSFILDTRWPNGRLLSEHTVLLDLPVFNQQNQPATPVQPPVSPLNQAPAQPQPAIVEPERTPTPPPAVTPAEVDTAPAEPVEQAPETEEPVEQAPEEVPAAVAPEVDEEDAAAAEESELAVEPEVETAPVAQAEPEPETEPVGVDETPAEPETIETSPNDTLTDIALQVRPNNNVSLQQTMLAIQRLNPDAFIDGNINRLRSGEVLRVPQLADVQEITAAEAISEINRQNQEFADLQPLAAPAAEPAAADNAQDGELSVVTDTGDADSAGVANDADIDALDQRIAELENTLALQQEEADRARIQREELESRLADLDEQIAAAQEIIRLQDLQLAQLQESLANAAAEAEAEAAAAAAQQAAIAAAEAEAQQLAARNGGLMNDIMRILTGNIMLMAFAVVLVILLLVVLLLRRNRSDKLEPADELDELAEQEFDAASDDVVAPVLGKQDDDNLDDADMDSDVLDSELDDIISANDDDVDFDMDFEPEDESSESVLEEAAALIAAAKLGEANALLRGALDEDPDDMEMRLKLAEVLAKQQDKEGFEAQAALIAEANRGDLDVVLETLRDQFVEDASLEDSQPPVEEDHTNAFLDDLGIDLDAFDDDDDMQGFADKPAAQSDSAESDEENDDESSDEDSDKDSDESEVDQAGAAATSAAAIDDDDFDLAFDLDDDEESDSESEQEDKPRAGEEETDAFEISLDDESDASDTAELAAGDSKDASDLEIETFAFDSGDAGTEKPEVSESEDDLELETFEFSTADLSDDEEPVATASDDAVAEDDDDNAIEFAFDKSEIDSAPEESSSDDLETFDFDLDDTVIEKPAPEAASKTESSENEISFDLEDDDPDPLTSGNTATSTASAADEDDDFDFDLDEFDVDETETPDKSASGQSKSAGGSADDTADDFFDLDEIDSSASSDAGNDDGDDELEDLEFLADEDDLEVEDLELLSDDDEAATKLELAYAYQKMGDAEGAREILKEVVKEGNADQVKEAEGLLASLDQQG